ncbi:hypothetical protein BJ912DRAFT_964794 [Pholiota molesta]|nr:hypothetical protein BJ912DRAFT_964794 [Pholiota molesta]
MALLEDFGSSILAVPDDASPTPAIEPSDPDVIVASPPEDPTPTVHKQRDPDFYFNSIFVVFEAENTLFRVPSHIFCNESEIFAKEFNLPTLNNPSGATSTIVLHDIQREDFCNLLKALYPLALSTKLSLSESEWISILMLSTKWCFKNLRIIAISELESLNSITSVNKIIFGRFCSISSWLLAGLVEIVEREESMSDDDMVALDHITVIALFKLRELRLRKNGIYYNSGSTHSITMDAIRSAFDTELVAVQIEETKFVVASSESKVSSTPPPKMPTKGKKKGKK